MYISYNTGAYGTSTVLSYDSTVHTCTLYSLRRVYDISYALEYGPRRICTMYNVCMIYAYFM